MDVVEFNGVWKKFKRGEKFNSLRDAIPNAFRSLFKKNGNDLLSKEEFWALKEVNFRVKQGEVLGIIGPNGAGKSTTLKLLSRIMNPNKGNISIRGRLSALIEITAGFHPELTGRENIYLNGTIMGMRKKEIDKKLDKIIDFSGITEFIDTPVKRYSSGMYSRLGFSVAAHMDPDVLLVDEVLAVGDMEFQTKCAQKMRELLASGTTIVLVSHNLSLVQSLCSRVIYLDHGTIQKEGDCEEVITFYKDEVRQDSLDKLKKEIGAPEVRGKVERAKIDLPRIITHSGDYSNKEEFTLNEPIMLAIEYETRENIESPILLLQIIRSDGILCCSSKTKDEGIVIDDIDGKGTIEIDLGTLNLSPGCYLLRFAVWDKNMIHPYVDKKNNVLKITPKNKERSVYGVFVPKIIWKFKRS
ncbi:MAG: ABC transporter ATP-binding protein [Candidatus Omnitrophica bacterium]|nr:ABC transporter ATP-binding protein [Candidatus Omnitrophota bacterium]